MSSKVARCLAPGNLIFRIILFLIGTGLGVFDTVTDWHLVINYKEHGFNHPLLPLDVNWLRAFYLFASIGTVLTTATFANEGLDLLYNILKAYKKLSTCCKRTRSHNITKANGTNTEDHDVYFLMKEEVTHSNSESELKKQVKEELGGKDDDGVEINDACKCCYRCGWNFTTRAETIAKLSLWFQGVPMLMLAVLYAYSQSTCKLPEERDVTGDLLNVALSAMATSFAVGFKATRSFLRLAVSVGLRMKSKQEATKMMGNCGKCVSKLLPEKGDAIYPQGTCAQCCIIPFYISLMFDISLVFMGIAVSLTIWINYILLSLSPNFDDSLSIFRYNFDDGRSVHLLNISNNIIPPSNGTFIGFETVTSSDGEVIHCLSEFVYREKDFQIYFDVIEVQAVSDKGVFCAAKSGEDTSDLDTYSSCTQYYTLEGFVLFYGFRDRITGKVRRFDHECLVFKYRLPVVHAGPVLDRSIDLEKKFNHTHLLKSPKDLLILYVSRTSVKRLLFKVPVADIVADYLDKTYLRTFPDPDTGDLTYLIRFVYDYNIAQFYYNVKEVLNYNPIANQSCSCATDLENAYSILKFYRTGELVYGYYDAENGNYPLLYYCSSLPQDKVRPQIHPSLSITCTAC